jgi:hypothetical protein
MAEQRAEQGRAGQGKEATAFPSKVFLLSRLTTLSQTPTVAKIRGSLSDKTLPIAAFDRTALSGGETYRSGVFIFGSAAVRKE